MRRPLLTLMLTLCASSANAAAPLVAGPGDVPFSQSLTSPYAARTAGEFAAACEKDQASCTGRIGNVLMSRVLAPPAAHICLPGISYAGAVAPWLKAHPETASMNAEDGITLALTTIYKCGPPNNY